MVPALSAMFDDVNLGHWRRHGGDCVWMPVLYSAWISLLNGIVSSLPVADGVQFTFTNVLLPPCATELLMSSLPLGVAMDPTSSGCQSIQCVDDTVVWNGFQPACHRWCAVYIHGCLLPHCATEVLMSSLRLYVPLCAFQVLGRPRGTSLVHVCLHFQRCLPLTVPAT